MSSFAQPTRRPTLVGLVVESSRTSQRPASAEDDRGAGIGGRRAIPRASAVCSHARHLSLGHIVKIARTIWLWARKIVIMPVGRIWWADAADARLRGSWDVVARRVEAIHRWHWENDNSRFLLAEAYGRLGRHPEAIEQIGRIREVLTSPMREQERLLQTAHSLNHLDRVQPAHALPVRRPPARRSDTDRDSHTCPGFAIGLQLAHLFESLDRLDIGRRGKVVLHSFVVVRSPDVRLEHGLSVLSHGNAQRLSPTPATKCFDPNIHGLEARDAQELTDETNRPLERSRHPGRAQSNGRDVPACGSPCTPIPAERRSIVAIANRLECRILNKVPQFAPPPPI